VACCIRGHQAGQKSCAGSASRPHAHAKGIVGLVPDLTNPLDTANYALTLTPACAVIPAIGFISRGMLYVF
jgi:hypothetical protein